MKHLIAVAILAATPIAALAQGTASVEGTSLYFIGLEDGATVANPLTVRFGLTGMGMAPAEIERDKTGHHPCSSTARPWAWGNSAPRNMNWPFRTTQVIAISVAARPR